MRRWPDPTMARRCPEVPRSRSGDPGGAGRGAAARAACPARRRWPDRGRTHRARVGFRDAWALRRRSRRGCAGDARWADRACPRDGARAGGRARDRRGERGPAGRRVRARAPAAGRLADGPLDDPWPARCRRPADPADGPARARGAPGRHARYEEPRAARRDRLPGQRQLVAGARRRALPRRGPAQRGGRDPRAQPSRPGTRPRRPTICTSPPRRWPPGACWTSSSSITWSSATMRTSRCATAAWPSTGRRAAADPRPIESAPNRPRSRPPRGDRVYCPGCPPDPARLRRDRPTPAPPALVTPASDHPARRTPCSDARPASSASSPATSGSTSGLPTRWSTSAIAGS